MVLFEQGHESQIFTTCSQMFTIIQMSFQIQKTFTGTAGKIWRIYWRICLYKMKKFDSHLYNPYFSISTTVQWHRSVIVRKKVSFYTLICHFPLRNVFSKTFHAVLKNSFHFKIKTLKISSGKWTKPSQNMSLIFNVNYLGC